MALRSYEAIASRSDHSVVLMNEKCTSVSMHAEVKRGRPVCRKAFRLRLQEERHFVRAAPRDPSDVAGGAVVETESSDSVFWGV